MSFQRYINAGPRRVYSQQTPTITASSAYANGNQIGGIQAIDLPGAQDGGVAILEGMSILDLAATGTLQMDFQFFWLSPNVTSTDKQNFALADADAAAQMVATYRFVGSGTSLQVTYGAGTLGTTSAYMCVPIPLKTARIWVVTICRGTPTFGSTSDLTFTYCFQLSDKSAF